MGTTALIPPPIAFAEESGASAEWAPMNGDTYFDNRLTMFVVTRHKNQPEMYVEWKILVSGSDIY